MAKRSAAMLLPQFQIRQRMSELLKSGQSPGRLMPHVSCASIWLNNDRVLIEIPGEQAFHVVPRHDKTVRFDRSTQRAVPFGMHNINVVVRLGVIAAQESAAGAACEGQ